MVLPVRRIPVSICCAKRRPTSFTHHVLEGDKPVHISRVFVPILLFGQSVAVYVEGVEFRPRAVVAGKEVVAVCTRTSSQENAYYK